VPCLAVLNFFEIKGVFVLLSGKVAVVKISGSSDIFVGGVGKRSKTAVRDG